MQGLKAMSAAFDFVGSALDLNARYLAPSLPSNTRQSRAMTGVRDALGSARRFGRKAQISFSDEQAAALDELGARVTAHPARATGSSTLEQKLRDIAQTLSLEDRLSDAGLEALSNCAHATKSARDAIVVGWDDDGTPKLTTHVADHLDFVGLWHGYFSTDQEMESVAADCFIDGRDLGIAEMACAIIQAIDDGEGGYTLTFTDDGGDTYQVSARDHILLGDSATGLDSLARKFPFLSACPGTVPPLDQ
ncbi:MAG: hypothetical protein ACRDWS_12965 [Acidimicrobiia bacterium]